MHILRPIAICVAAVSLVACGSTVSPARRAAQGSAAAELGERPASNGSAADLVSTIPSGGAVAGGPSSARGAANAARTGAGAAGSRTTADRGPITVGILVTNNDAAPSAGVDNGDTFSARRAFEGYVAAYNARGGLAGRRIAPVYAELRSSSVSLPADMQAACETFTRDAHAAVVLSTVGLYSEALSQCLAKAHTPQIAGDYALGDTTSLNEVPSFYAVSTMTIDDRMRALFEQGALAHRLAKTDKIGVVVEGCPFNARAYARTVVPTAQRLGLTISDHVESRCFESFDQFGGLASDMAGAVLRFRSAGVTKVVFVSGSIEGNLMLLFGTAAESQGWRPGYGLTSTAAPVIQEGNTPKSQLANAFGLGWLPMLDSTRASATQPAAQRCVTDLKAGAGVTPQTATDRYDAFSICDTFALYEAALRATLGATDPASVATAVSRMGTGFTAATTHGGVTDFGGGRRTGPAQGRLFAWSTACGCFDYTGAPFSLTTR
jgi:hypothetical protein